MRFIRKFFGYCGNCNKYLKYPKRRRMNTAYIDEESNYICECSDCFKLTQEYWQERWDDYNSERF